MSLSPENRRSDMRIQSLDPDVVKKLQSDIAITNVAHCVEELVWNSIDAGANCIAVRLNLLVYKIQVIDNGSGIPFDQMVLVGKRYATSKCHTLDDLKNLQYGGFRGEALSSLKEVSSNLMIESRASGFAETYCKIFTHGKASKPTISINSRPSKGTTVTVYDFMYNRPVRKNTISEAIDLEETRKLLQSITLVHPSVSFSLQSDATGEICLQFKKCTSTCYAFMQLFGKEKSRNLKLIEHQHEDYKITGYISVDFFPSKDYQFLYVNKRLILRTFLHKLVNNILNKAIGGRQTAQYAAKRPASLIHSPNKNQAQYCVFVLDITCSRDKYDIIFDRKRTMVEFSEWDKVSKLVENSILIFLKAEKLVTSPPIENKLVPNRNENDGRDSLFVNLGIDNFKNGLFSHAVKRLVTMPPATPEVCLDSTLQVCSNINCIDHCETTNPTLVTLNDTSLHNASDCTKEHHNSNTTSENKKFICLRNTTVCTSILDGLKGINDKGATPSIKSDFRSSAIGSASSSLGTQPDIPCRSVFPTQNPVMLRVPVESTLSQLEKKGSSSRALFKLREKYTFVHKSRKWTGISNSYMNENSRGKLGNLKDNHRVKTNVPKPSIPRLEQSPNIDESSKVNKIDCHVIKEIKSSQPSLLDKNDYKITSKYIFRGEPNLSPLKRLCRCNKSNTKLPASPERSNGRESSNEKFEAFKTKVIHRSTDNLMKLMNENYVFKKTHFKATKSKNRLKNLGSDYHTFQTGSKDCTTISKKPMVLESDKFYSRDNRSKHTKSTTSNVIESNTYSILSTFHATEKENDNHIIPLEKDKTSIKSFAALKNFHRMEIEECHGSSIENTKNNQIVGNDKCISSLEKLQASTEFVTPQIFFNSKKLKSCSQVAPCDTSTGERYELNKYNVNSENSLNKNRAVDIFGPAPSTITEKVLTCGLIEDTEADIGFEKIVQNTQTSNSLTNSWIDDQCMNNRFVSLLNSQNVHHCSLLDAQKESVHSSIECSPVIPFQNLILCKEIQINSSAYTNFCNDSPSAIRAVWPFRPLRHKLNQPSAITSPDLEVHSNPNPFSPINVSSPFSNPRSVNLRDNDRIPSCSACVFNPNLLIKDQNLEVKLMVVSTFSKGEVSDGESARDDTDVIFDTNGKSQPTFDYTNLPLNLTDDKNFNNIAQNVESEDVNVTAQCASVKRLSSLPNITTLNQDECDLGLIKNQNPSVTDHQKTCYSENEFEENVLTLATGNNVDNNTTLKPNLKSVESGTSYINNCSEELLNNSTDCNSGINNINLMSNFILDSNSVTASPKSSRINSLEINTTDSEHCDVQSSEINSRTDKVTQSRWICQINEETKRIAYIDSVTGNSTYTIPESLQPKDDTVPEDQESTNGHLKRPHFFLTHNFSPFVKDKHAPKESTDLDDEICDLQIDLNSFIENKEVNDWQRKWRYPVNQTNPSGDDVEDMFNKWENPMFDIPAEVTSIDNPKVPVCLPHMYILNSYRFNHCSLNSLKVIGQVDCKFIACIIQDFNTNCKNKKLLTLFDQHAVHERIRLEELIEDLYEVQEDGKRTVKSSPISPPLALSLESEEIRLLRTYHTHLQDVGIHLSLEDDANSVQVFSLPACLVHKDTNQLRRKVPEASILVEKIIKEWLASLLQSRGVSSILPKTLSAVLNSQACRGAVKFGDPLDLQQCEKLLTSLSNCKLPFQCAHGRPSIAPILDLNKIEILSRKINPPQLWKLRKK